MTKAEAKALLERYGMFDRRGRISYVKRLSGFKPLDEICKAAEIWTGKPHTISERYANGYSNWNGTVKRLAQR